MTNAIIEAFLAAPTQTKDGFWRLARQIAAAHERPMPPTSALRRAYTAIVAREPARRSAALEKMLVRRDIRSLSGVAIITVLTKPYPCPGRCIYCPTDARMPKSYLPNEPAAARALTHRFDPYAQTAWRLRALTENGHHTDKIELIVKGGTWSSYPPAYQDWFIKRCFDACNRFGSPRGRSARTLLSAQDLNEKAKHRIVGLTLETRPDRITPMEIVRLRRLGCTRIELGVQSVNDDILKRCHRGHDAAAVTRAARLLKDAGFKTDFHLMPQLPGATPLSDRRDLEDVFDDPNYRPDMIKIYPCVVVPEAELYELWKRGAYRPYSDKKLFEVLIAAKLKVPRYCRISRLIRDIPSDAIVAGNATTNLRETLQREMKKRGLACACLRCREIGHAAKDDPRLLRARPMLFDDPYEASGGTEHFLSLEDRRRRAVFAFCRLRLPSRDAGDSADLRRLMPEIRDAALLRELHTYGHLVPLSSRDSRASQHKGFGRRLMKEAERLARRAGFPKLAVISGIGVREYYRKLGYRREGTYMVKKLISKT